jgi:hypothetical protein
MFYVMCRVSGGVTGTRQSLAKNNGVVKTFKTHADAAAEAKKLTAVYNGDPYRKAFFEYWAVSEIGCHDTP